MNNIIYMNKYVDDILNIKAKINNNDYKNFLNNNVYNRNIEIKTNYHEKIKLLFCDNTASSFQLKFVEKLYDGIFKIKIMKNSENSLDYKLSSLIIKQVNRYFSYLKFDARYEYIFGF